MPVCLHLGRVNQIHAHVQTAAQSRDLGAPASPVFCNRIGLQPTPSYRTLREALTNYQAAAATSLRRGAFHACWPNGRLPQRRTCFGPPAHG